MKEILRGLEKLRLVDFGSGDGRIVQMAAEKGMRATGYELNPCPVEFTR
jgi:2-polyprenyl-3-methyl-5-hydroxy-6-metoxy-1,4-benzoquinol methylase